MQAVTILEGCADTWPQCNMAECVIFWCDCTCLGSDTLTWPWGSVLRCIFIAVFSLGSVRVRWMEVHKSVTLIGVHSRGIAPQTHKIITLGAHYFPRPLLLTLTRMASLHEVIFMLRKVESTSDVNNSRRKKKQCTCTYVCVPINAATHSSLCGISTVQLLTRSKLWLNWMKMTLENSKPTVLLMRPGIGLIGRIGSSTSGRISCARDLYMCTVLLLQTCTLERELLKIHNSAHTCVYIYQLSLSLSPL